MNMKRIITTLTIAMGIGIGASAQNWAVSTNVVDYASLGTINVQAKQPMLDPFGHKGQA